MALKAAFLFLAPGANPGMDRRTFRTPRLDLTVVGVPDYTAAEIVAQELAGIGIVAIELGGGFGHAGTARVRAAVGPHVAVGTVRFDTHPNLGGKSGDAIFGDRSEREDEHVTSSIGDLAGR